ncbi:MAG: hypothetical protein ACRC28_15630 [Clostridium sp.]|uniref:hypothetical protein n=1 Tax=Clostridium sp. TaxID=1506 RepID=UPI003F3F982F
MKKVRLVFLCVTMALATVSFIGCTNKGEKTSEKESTLLEAEKDNKKETKDEEVKDDKNNSDIQKAEEKDSELESLKSNNKDNTINESNIVEKNEKLKYPVLAEKKANKVVEEYINKISSLYDLAELNYKIMYQDSKAISIFFFGNIKAESSAYPSKFESTLNINLESAKIIKLSDIVNIDKAFIEKFKEALVSKCTSLGVNASDLFDLENLEELLKKSDNVTEYLPEVQSCFTQNELEIILSVPHAIGDYIKVRVSIF